MNKSAILKNFIIDIDIPIRNSFNMVKDSSIIHNLIKLKYLNKCYKESYILDIVNIVIGPIRSILNSLSTNVCTVQFTAEVLILNNNDVILAQVDEVIYKGDNDNNITQLKCKALNNNIIIYILELKYIPYFVKDDIILIQLSRIEYISLRDHIIAFGIPFIPDKIIYKIESTINIKRWDILNKYISENFHEVNENMNNRKILQLIKTKSTMLNITNLNINDIISYNYNFQALGFIKLDNNHNYDEIININQLLEKYIYHIINLNYILNNENIKKLSTSYYTFLNKNL